MPGPPSLRRLDRDVLSFVRSQFFSAHLATAPTQCHQPLERHPGHPLLDEVRALSAWLKERPEDGSGILFTSTHGGAMNRSTFFRLWRSLAIAAGLPSEKLHPHVAKHTLGTMLARQNVSAFLIKQALGHRAVSSTQVYTAVSDQDAGRATRAAFMATF